MSRDEQLYWLMSNSSNAQDPQQNMQQQPGGSSVPDPRDTSIAKKRRGRQPRQSLVSPSLQAAIRKFASIIGAPILQPGGFRDFTGWLDTISAPKFRSAWMSLSNAFLAESATTSPDHIYQLKRDVVHEIINLVVKRKAHESSKLVSTNARRQSSIPPTGSTVMTIFESYLAVASAPYSVHHQKLSASSPSASASSAFSAQAGGNNHHHTGAGLGFGGSKHGSNTTNAVAGGGRYPSSSSSLSPSGQQAYHAHAAAMAHAHAVAAATAAGINGGNGSTDPAALRRQHSSVRGGTQQRDMYASSSSSLSRTASNSSDSRSSKSSSSSSGGRPSSSSMDISALISGYNIDELGGSGGEKSRGAHHGRSSKLPSLSQLDAHLRARCEKERRSHR